MWCGQLIGCVAHCTNPSPSAGSVMMASLLEPCGHHREHLLRGVGAEVDHDRAVVDLVGLLDGRLHLLGRVDPHPDAAHGLGPELVVGQVGREVHLGVALLVEHLLPLAHHAEVGVVQDGDLHGDALGRGGDELLRGHLEAAVAVDGPDHRVGTTDLGADGGRHGEAHGAEAAGVHPGVGVVELPVLGGPHLVLADARGDDAVVGGVVAQLLEHVLRLERVARLALLVGERVLLPPAGDRLLPGACDRAAWRRRPAGPCSTETSSSITRRQSPTIGTSGRRTLPISAGSMSTWMILASVAKSGILPVTRSSKRLPSAMSRSLFCIDVTAV